MDNKHKKMKQAMQMSKVNMPFDDFEQRIMGQIADLENAKSKALSDRKYAIIFFLLGSICGILLNNYWMNRLEAMENDGHIPQLYNDTLPNCFCGINLLFLSSIMEIDQDTTR